MTDFMPTLDENAPRRDRKLPGKGLIIAIGSVVILIAGVFGFTAWQESSNLKLEIANIELLINNDDFPAALTAIAAAQEEFKDNSDLLNLEDKVDVLKTSRTSFEEGLRLISEKNYESALNFLKKVNKLDQKRFTQAQSRIEEAQSAYASQVLGEAQVLKAKNNYIDALAVITRAASSITIGSELLALKEELTPLAQEETRKAEEAKLAVYRSALKSMKVNTDQFNGIKFYKDRSTPYYANYSTIHLYIGKKGEADPYLRFVLRYSDDDWLFINDASINIDGDVRSLDLGSDWERDNGSGDIWEWVDVVATDSHIDLIRDVIKSEKSIIRYNGSKYFDDRTITSTQKRALQNVLNAYEALKL